MGYALMGLAGLSLVPILAKGRIELVIRWCFAVNAVFRILGGIASVASSNPLHGLVLASLGIWAVTFPIATALLAVVFRRARNTNM